MNKILLISFTSLCCFGCNSGTFVNHPQTWNKVFGEEIPKEVEIINSRFWKSPHFTYEFELFMKFKAKQSFVKSFFIEKFKFTKTLKPQFDLKYDEEKPQWFVPKKFDSYYIWKSKINSMTLFIDKTSNLMYLYALQF